MPSPLPPGPPRSMRHPRGTRGTSKKNQVFSLVALVALPCPQANVTTMPACSWKITTMGGGVLSLVALPCLEARGGGDFKGGDYQCETNVQR